MLAAKMHSSLQTPISVCRTTIREDALISPFLLDPSSVTLLTKHSSRRHQGVWLHMPVMVRIVDTREQALQHVHYMSRLRHPNLEQFLGAVVDDRSQKAVITELVTGRSLAEMLPPTFGTPLSEEAALTVALDVARALVYLHAKTGAPHAGICAKSVLFDSIRCRAVVLLSTHVRSGPPCAAPEARRGDRVGYAADVYSLAALLCQMFLAMRGLDVEVDASRVYILPKRLQGVVWSALQESVTMRPSIEELCQALTDCLETYL